LNMKIKMLENGEPAAAVMGHVGAGHVNSHSGLVQDDSAGFAVAAYLLREAMRVSTTIKEITASIHTATVTVVTEGGGEGSAESAAGITPYEIELLERARGVDAIYSQHVATKVLGRVYGQGGGETSVALIAAASLAVIDTLSRDRNSILTGKEENPNNCGAFAGGIVELEGIPVSVVVSVNATLGGVGPNEDLEGNVALGEKGEIIKKLKGPRLPTVVLESKAFDPGVSPALDSRHIWIRANRECDNQVVARSLAEAAKQLNFPYIFSNEVMPLSRGRLKEKTIDFADRVIETAESLKEAENSSQKVQAVYRLLKLAREEAGGITFMTDELYDTVRAVGLIPGTSAVLSMLVPPDEKEYWKIPLLTGEDLQKYLEVLVRGLEILKKYRGEAAKELERKYVFPEDQLNRVVYYSKTGTTTDNTDN